MLGSQQLLNNKPFTSMRLIISLITALLISGCATTSAPTALQTQWSPELYYGEARKAQSSGDYKTAIKYFSELEIYYPHSPYSQLAPIETGYANYKLKKFNMAIKEVDRFIYTYPDHDNIDYAYYLKGLASSEQAHIKTDSDTETTAAIINTDLARQAFSSFSTVIQKFPDSQYRDNSMQRMNTLRNQLARHELQAVKTKLKNGDKEGAYQLAKYISEQYPKTRAAAEAFEIITSASSSIISPDTASQTVSVMAEPQPIKQGHADNDIAREKWLLQQNPTHFTLQLIGTSSQDKLETYIRKHQLQDKAAYFHRSLNNKDWYSLLYGSYSQREAATADTAQLKKALELDKIWIRQFKDVQASITQGQPGN